jgi:hypothetical protein
VKASTLALWTQIDDAVMVYTTPTTGHDERVIVPMGVLEAVEGSGNEPVELTIGPKLQGVARWSSRGVPQTHPFDAVLPGKQHQLPDPPSDWRLVSSAFLSALHECGRSASKDPTRYALNRIQVRGADGRVIGTNGKTALLWGGFDLPFVENLLVPAVPVFGSREMTSGGTIRVGRTPKHLVVESGSWRVCLSIDPGGRFPDVGGVVPKNSPTVAGIDERDAVELLGALPGLPVSDEEYRPVTVDLNGGVVVSARDETSGAVQEVRLVRSPSAGPSAVFAIDRRVLARALELGCVTLGYTPDRPIVFEGGDKTFVAAALEPGLIVRSTTPVPQARNALPLPTPERKPPVKPHESNGHPPSGQTPNARHDPPPDTVDPLVAAEELRAALADAAVKASRLVAALKSQKKEKKVLRDVWAGLKQVFQQFTFVYH